MSEQQDQAPAAAGGREDQAVAEPRVVSIGCGSAHSLALLATPRDSVAVSFGRGEDGQLGLGHAEDAPAPVAIAALIGRHLSSVHCGAEYSIAVSRADRTIFSWGWGDFGRLGQEDCNDVFVPAPIAGLVGKVVAAVACGDTHTLVATEEGEVFAFGRNASGQLGLGHLTDSLVPQVVEALRGKRVVGVACGAEHSVCVTDEGSVYAWGWGSYYCIGDGANQNRCLPTLVKGLDGVRVVRVACGWRHSAAIDDQGRLWTWGWGKYGQLGHGNTMDQPLPKLVEGLAGVKTSLVTGGWRHTLTADDHGALYGFGWNRFGQLGLGHTRDASSPQRVALPQGERAAQCVSGWKHTLLVAQSGKVYSWGRAGPLGLGPEVEEDVSLPREVVALSSGSIDVEALVQGAHPGVAHSIPAADRYAVVPDQEVGGGSTSHAVPDAVPEAKRQRTERT